jgi:hypothetical protein
MRAHVHAHEVTADGTALALAAPPLGEGLVVELVVLVVRLEIELDGADLLAAAAASAATTAA